MCSHCCTTPRLPSVLDQLPFFSYAVKKYDEVESLSTDIDNMTNDLRLRNKRHRDMRNKLKMLTTYKFDVLLRMNDYSGELRFDDGGDGKPGTLDLVVRKGSGGQTTDVKGLRFVHFGLPLFCLAACPTVFCAADSHCCVRYQWWRAKLFNDVSSSCPWREVGDPVPNL
jgi:hypothetical protein